jgi:hypothetical protein
VRAAAREARERRAREHAAVRHVEAERPDVGARAEDRARGLGVAKDVGLRRRVDVAGHKVRAAEDDDALQLLRQLRVQAQSEREVGERGERKYDDLSRVRGGGGGDRGGGGAGRGGARGRRRRDAAEAVGAVDKVGEVRLGDARERPVRALVHGHVRAARALGKVERVARGERRGHVAIDGRQRQDLHLLGRVKGREDGHRVVCGAGGGERHERRRVNE